MVWIDSHCHLDAPEFAPDRLAVRAAARAAGVQHCVLPAVRAADFEPLRQLAATTGDSYALGIHPLCTDEAGEQDLATLDAALGKALGTAMNTTLDAPQPDAALVAVGEIGLDAWVAVRDEPRQTFFYREQLRLARRHDLPVILHVRRSADALLKGLRELPVRGGIVHAFNGSEVQAHAFIARGFKLGFGGVLSFERALNIRRLATRLPLSALVLETDAPDMPPQWLYTPAQARREGVPPARNTPAELPRVAALLAQLRGIPVEELAQATRHNLLQALPRLAGRIGA